MREYRVSLIHPQQAPRIVTVVAEDEYEAVDNAIDKIHASVQDKKVCWVYINGALFSKPISLK